MFNLTSNDRFIDKIYLHEWLSVISGLSVWILFLYFTEDANTGKVKV